MHAASRFPLHSVPCCCAVSSAASVIVILLILQSFPPSVCLFSSSLELQRSSASPPSGLRPVSLVFCHCILSPASASISFFCLQPLVVVVCCFGPAAAAGFLLFALRRVVFFLSLAVCVGLSCTVSLFLCVCPCLCGFPCLSSCGVSFRVVLVRVGVVWAYSNFAPLQSPPTILAHHSKFEFEVHHVVCFSFPFLFGLVLFKNCAFGQDMRASTRGAAALFVSAGMPVRTYRLARRLAPWHQPRRARDS
jgi:hypothetical protein